MAKSIKKSPKLTRDVSCGFHHVVAYYPSHSAKKPSYLNTGLTSTKNYGKTILTKVCALDFSQHVTQRVTRPSEYLEWSRCIFCVGVVGSDAI